MVLINRGIDFACIKMFYTDYLNSKQKEKQYKLMNLAESYQNEIKIVAYPWLVYRALNNSAKECIFTSRLILV